MDNLSIETAQLYRRIQTIVTEVDIVFASAGQKQPRDGSRMQSISVKLPKLEIGLGPRVLGGCDHPPHGHSVADRSS